MRKSTTIARLAAIFGAVALFVTMAAPASADWVGEYDWSQTSTPHPCLDGSGSLALVADAPFTAMGPHVLPTPNSAGWSFVQVGNAVEVRLVAWDCDPHDDGSRNQALYDAGVRRVEYSITGADWQRRPPAERQGHFERPQGSPQFSSCYGPSVASCRGLRVVFEIKAPGITYITYRIVDLEGWTSGYQTVTVKLTSNIGVSIP